MSTPGIFSITGAAFAGVALWRKATIDEGYIPICIALICQCVCSLLLALR